MRNSLWLATFVASSLIASVPATTVYGQGSSPGTNVAVLDVGKVFKEHIRFDQQMKVMKKDVEAYEARIRNERSNVQRMAEDLKRFKTGTPEYSNLEAQIAKITSDMQVQMKLKQRDFMQREAKLYYNTYVEVTQAVASLAQRSGIQLVLRYNSEEITPENRNSVLAGVNANVVYQNRRDITEAIINVLNVGSRVGDRTRPTGPPIPGGRQNR